MEKTQGISNTPHPTVNGIITPIENVIRENNIVVFSPHYDDVLFMMGGYIGELSAQQELAKKNFHINLLFSKSNYLARTGAGNANRSLERIKLATGNRLLEDQECLDELLGKFNYRYELIGEAECFVRGKMMEGELEMEFPHGMYLDFNEEDNAIFSRLKDLIREWAKQQDTALVFPIAFKEHIDHFITREAAITVATELGKEANAVFYFQEDKPYGGIADEAELGRIDVFIRQYQLEPRTYEYDPELMITLAFKHYITQVEEVYKKGIRNRSQWLQESVGAGRPCDRIYQFHAQPINH